MLMRIVTVSSCARTICITQQCNKFPISSGAVGLLLMAGNAHYGVHVCRENTESYSADFYKRIKTH